MNQILLKGADVVLASGSVKTDLLVTDGVIAKIGAGITDLERGRTIDLAGATVFPGFIDVHIHGAVGVDTMNASAADLLKVSEFLATQGGTGWLPTLVPGSVEEYL